MTKKKLAAIIAGVLLLTGGGVFAAQKVTANKKASSIQTASVTASDFVKAVTSSGKTKAEKSAELKFQTSGRLAWVNVKEGDRVSAYQAIAGMDTREVQKTLEKYLIDYSEQRNTFEDTRKYDTQATTPKDAWNDQMKHLLEANQWDLNKAVLDVELKHLAVEYATLVTPIAGIVTHIDTPVAGVNITPAGAAFEISDPSSLVFEANIDETDVGSLVVGQKATIALDAFGEASFSGTVSWISYTSVISAGGATVFPVKIAFDKPETLRIGLNGDVSIEVARYPSVLTVPTEAIREGNGGKFVYKKEADGYQAVPVTVTSQNDTRSVIGSGLSAGDLVVVKGFDAIPKAK